MNHFATLFVSSLAAFGTLLATAAADLLVYEPFDYPDGPLNGRGGARGTTGTWVTNDTGFAQGWWVHPEGQVSGAWTSGSPVVDEANAFDGTVDNLPTAGGFAGMPGPEDKGTTPGVRSPTGNMDAHIALDPAVTASFQPGTTTWFSFVGVRADDRNEGMPTLMFCTDPTTDGSRGLNLQNGGEGICGGGGPPRFNLLSIYPSYFSGGVRQQAPGGYLGGALGGHDGTVPAFCSTATCDGVLGPAQKIAMPMLNPDGSFGAPAIAVGKIEWDAGDGGEDIITVVAFLESDELTKVNFDMLVADQPDLSSANWPSNKPDLDQSQFDTLNIASLKFFVDEIRVATSFEEVVGLDATAPLPFEIVDVVYDPGADSLVLTWRARAGKSYAAKYTGDLADGWVSELADSLGPDDDEVADDGDLITVTFDLADLGIGGLDELFFRIEEEQ